MDFSHSSGFNENVIKRYYFKIWKHFNGTHGVNTVFNKKKKVYKSIKSKSVITVIKNKLNSSGKQ